MNSYFQRLLFGLILINFVLMNNLLFAEEMTTRQIELNLIDRLARLEEGQKAIISEMKIRFEAVDKRFEAVDKRFEALLREMKQRFESVDKRFESVDKRIDQLGNYNITMIATLVALIGYIIWDRKTAFNKAFSNQFPEIRQKMQAA